MEEILWNHVQTVKQTSPLVHNITNFVVMNNTANALLAVGASPIMAHAHSEIEEMVKLCQSFVINIGTLDEYWVTSMKLVAQKAHQLKKPWILDPVGAGATTFRNETLSELLNYKPTIIRGNASEILALAKANNTITKGVDSTVQSEAALDAAKFIQQKYNTIVCISGATDFIVSENQIISIDNGNSLMTKVTGLGCSSTAVIGAFIAAIENKLEAVVAANSLFSVCGELAAENSSGPGSLQVNLLDKLYNITEAEFVKHLKMKHNA